MPPFLAQQDPSPQQPQPVEGQPGAGAPGAAGQRPATGLCNDPFLPILLLLMYGVFYFLVIRPQNKAEKARKAKIEGIKKGDEVRTRGGIVAPVVRVKDDQVGLRLDADTRVEITVAKSYVDEVLSEGAADGK